MRQKLIHAALAFDGVERLEAGGPPRAFRIWKQGDNTTDHGPTFFTERSAKALLEQQARRGNRYSIDVNHLSLSKDAPIENQRAVGWFDIEVRAGELWAVNVDWTDTVRAGLTKDPPEWRYHSPAYNVDAKTGEVLSLTNLALTNNPATWSVTALATCRAMGKKPMKWSDIKAALDGDDEDKKAAAYAAIQAAFPDEEGDEKKKGDEKKEAKKAADPEPEKKEAKKCAEEEPEEEPEKKDVAASLVAELDGELKSVKAELAAYREEREAAERKALIGAREMTPELAKKLASMPLATVKAIAETLPTKTEKSTTENVQATRGASQDEKKSAALPPQEKKALDERMGLVKREASIIHDGCHSYFPVLTADDARRILAAKGGK